MDNRQPEPRNSVINFTGAMVVISQAPFSDKKFLRLLGRHETNACILRDKGDAEGARKQLAECAILVVKEAQNRFHAGQSELPIALASYPRFQCAYQTGIEQYQANQALFANPETQDA